MASKSKLYPSKATPLSKTTSSSSTSASNLTFATSLTSLLATSATNNETRPRPSRSSHSQNTNNRDSIFTAHNKGLHKRALADDISSETPSAQKHSKTSESIDAATLHRSKRKMEEKARLYASMKRGDYVPSNNGRDKEAEGLVDFDRKWAEKEDKDPKDDEDNTSSDDYNDGDEDEDPSSQVEYEDEFGRLRTGSKADVLREQRRRIAQAHATASLADASARPQVQRPDNLIRGDTVQAAAFNPDAAVAEQMAALAGKRDRSATPPEEVHYDARKEVRTKGVGFFQFSREKEGREREMEGLAREREETERGRREGEGRKEERRRKVEERRRVVAEKRGERLAERFLDGLDVG